MKSFLVIVVNCMVITSIFIQCKSVKTEIKDQRYIGVEEWYNKERKDAANQQDTMFFYCNDFRGYLDNKTKNIVAYNNGTIEYCLREKAFLGDTASISQIAALIQQMQNPFESFNKRLRGKIIFKAVLDRLNNFEFIPGPDGDMDNHTYFSTYGRVLVDMIESIDSVSQSDYISRYFDKRFKLLGIESDFVSKQYIQTSCKVTWEIYKEAYDKGLIKLKDFGQE